MIFFSRAALALGVSRGIYAKKLTTKEPGREENFDALWPSVFGNQTSSGFSISFGRAKVMCVR
jgi:hypothetical protein